MLVANAFQWFTEQYATYGYLVLGLGVLLENAGIPVPGETAVLAAGFLCSSAGGARLHLGWVILLASAAAIVGDNVSFWVGRRFARPRIQRHQGFLWFHASTIQPAEKYFQRYGAWTVFFARFITGLRVVAALVAGTAGMAWPHFLLANAAGAASWATAISLLGYWFGRSWEAIHRWLGWGGLVVCVGIIVLITLVYIGRRWRKAASDSPS
jgi:membrane-associated protein